MNRGASFESPRAPGRTVEDGRNASARGGRPGRWILGVAIVSAFTWVLPGVAMACTVCMGGQEEASRKAFIGTTAFLTFFPLLMLGLGVGWFVRRTLAQEREEEAARRIAELAPPKHHDPLNAA